MDRTFRQQFPFLAPEPTLAGGIAGAHDLCYGYYRGRRCNLPSVTPSEVLQNHYAVAYVRQTPRGSIQGPRAQAAPDVLCPWAPAIMA